MNKIQYSVLRITDGIESVDFLSGNRGSSGLFLKEWRMGRSNYKGGGTFNDSPLSAGRKLVFAVLDNVVETFVFGVYTGRQIAAARELAKLDRLLEKAATYSLDEWANEPVWLEMKLSQSSLTQYALVHMGAGDDYDEPFGQTFSGGAKAVVLQTVTRAIERGVWSEHKPGESTQIFDLDGVSQIIEHITDNDGSEVFVTNKHQRTNITNLYQYDSSATSYSADLMGSASVVMFPDPPGSSDALYFIARSSVGNAGPFSNLVFNVSSVAEDLSVVFEYWDGSAWTALDVEDNTQGFTVRGKNGVYWQQPADWATTTINTHLGWIVRCRVSAVFGSPVSPILDEVPFSTVVPFVKIPSTAVGGTLPADGRLDIVARTGDTNFDSGFDRVIVGMRSTERGESFSPFLSFSDLQTSSLYDSISTLHPGVSFNDDPSFPLRRRLNVTPYESMGSPVYDEWQDDLTASIDPAIISHFAGKFRAFIRAYTYGVGSYYWPQIRAKIEIGGTSGIVQYTEENRGQIYSIETGLYEVGTITIPSVGDVDSLELTLQTYWPSVGSTGVAATGTEQIVVMDLVLIPADEWNADFTTGAEQMGGFSHYSRISLDSITYPKQPMTSRVFDSAGNFAGEADLSFSGELKLPQNSEVAFWFLFARRYLSIGLPGITIWRANPEYSASVKAYKSNRYHGFRNE